MSLVIKLISKTNSAKNGSWRTYQTDNITKKCPVCGLLLTCIYCLHPSGTVPTNIHWNKRQIVVGLELHHSQKCWQGFPMSVHSTIHCCNVLNCLLLNETLNTDFGERGLSNFMRIFSLCGCRLWVEGISLFVVWILCAVLGITSIMAELMPPIMR